MGSRYSDARDIADQGAGVASAIADRAADAAHTFRSKAAELRARAGDALGSARDMGAQAARTASRQVEAHPLSSVGVAFAVGLVAGILLDRILGPD